MGPSKRKGSVRRPVLDLNAKDNSPSRPTWQTKYQHVHASEDVQENGDASSHLNNPLSNLIGNYNSDSENEETVTKPNTALDAKVEDFLKEICSISVEAKNSVQKAEEETTQNLSQQNQEQALYPSSVTAWQQCYDHNSGYPYYWNTETNEVTWEMPAELKAALTSIAIKQQEQQQNKLQPQQKLKKQSQPPEDSKKKVVVYPWQTESDSEDEKIEMITSFGPQSDEESENETKKAKIKKSEKDKKLKRTIGPQYLLPSMDPSKIKSDSFTPDDSESVNETTYETSSLLTHCVQDTGPPGDDTFHTNKECRSSKKPITLPAKKESSAVPLTLEKVNSSLNTLDKPKSVITDNLLIESSTSEVNSTGNSERQSSKVNDKTHSVIDDVIAQIENENPPENEKVEKLDKIAQESNSAISDISSQTNPKSSGIALIANYGDDSETEDSSLGEKKQSCKKNQNQNKSLFSAEIPQERDEGKPKPLFPCMESELPKMADAEGPKSKDLIQDEPSESVNIYNADVDSLDGTSLKAFKRKKRLEFATTIYGPSTSKLPEMKASSPERPVTVSNCHYNMDPNLNEHRGFGFSSLRNEMDSERKTYKNCGGIKFVKAETINPSAIVTESKEQAENEFETASAPGKSTKESDVKEEIEEAATLLREKVTFLTGGNTQIPPIQYMAIELETLVLAWQQGALTPPYLLRWLNEKCAELIRHEKSAAPSGWTCLWDRKNKRYYYRNSTTKVTQWDYPSVEEKSKGKDGDVVGGGDEMDICDTPPHMSPAGSEKHADSQPSTPLPPIASDSSDNVLPQNSTVEIPPPSQISYSCESETSVVSQKKAKKRKIKLESKGDGEETVAKIALESYEQGSEFNEAAPPLPPMPPPPPPPPPPDESPPPLPDSPPPLPLDPDQPLPPGVDEPEYALYRKTSPKHSYKKSQNESTAYSADLMMSYGYGYSSNGQPITMQMQPLEYHTYMHESVSNPYLVQSAPTSHVIQCSAKKPKVSLNSELMSFYSDLAMLDASSNDGSNSESQTTSSATVTTQEQTVITSVTSTTTVTASTISTNTSSSLTTPLTTTTAKTMDGVTSNGLNVKKKKKVKSTTGLALKKKGVSSLVAKWQQVQQEVRKDFSDDDDDDDNGATR